MIQHISDFIRYRELIELLTAREIKIRYKQTALGILWALFQPLIMVILFSGIFTKIVKMPSSNIPYPLFLLSALLPWTFFANSLLFAIPSIVNNAELVRKIYFPRVVFPIVSILACATDFLVSMVLLFILIVLYHISFSKWVFFLPVLIFLQLILTVAISLLFSSLNVLYRDVKNALASLIQIWMFATPVIYPLEVVRPHFRIFLLLNPMSGIIDTYRNILVLQAAPNGLYLFISTGMSLAIFYIAYHLFKKLEPTFADNI